MMIELSGMAQQVDALAQGKRVDVTTVQVPVVRLPAFCVCSLALHSVASYSYILSTLVKLLPRVTGNGRCHSCIGK